MADRITEKELNVIKQFTTAWIKTYYVLPPESLLSIIVILMRIVERYENQILQIKSIQYAEANTLGLYYRRISNVNSMRY